MPPPPRSELGALTPADLEIAGKAGVPSWRAREQHGIATQAQAEAEKALRKGTYGSKLTEELKELMGRHQQEYAPYQISRGEVFPLEVGPGVEAPFTAFELINISKDYDFARQVYIRATGRPDPSKLEVKGLQQKVDEIYPRIEEVAGREVEQRFRGEELPRYPGGDADAETLRASTPIIHQMRQARNELLKAKRIAHYVGLSPQERQRQYGHIPLESLEKEVVDLKRALDKLSPKWKRRDTAEERDDRLHGWQDLINDKETGIFLLREKTLPSPQEATAAAQKASAAYLEAKAAWQPFKEKMAFQAAQQGTVRDVTQGLNRAIREGKVDSYEQAKDFLEENLSARSIPALLPGLEEYFSKEKGSAIEGAQTPLGEREKQRLFKRLEGVHHLQELQGRGVRIAPFTPLHKEAEHLLRRSAENTQERGKAQEERLQRIGASIPPSPEILGQWQQAHQSLGALDRPFQTQVEEHFNPYEEKALKARYGLADERWKSEIAPSIKRVYASMGLHGSPALQDALSRRREKYEVGLRREEDILRERQWEQARRAAEGQQQRALEKSRQHGQLSEQQQAQLIRQEGVAQPAASQAKLHEQMDVTAMGQEAQRHQAQHQHELDERKRMFEEEKLSPMQMLDIQAGISRGLQTPPALTNFLRSEAPAPPSGANVVAGVLGGLMGTPQPRAAGGRVKNKFADGGMPSWQQLAPQEDKYSGEQKRIAESLENYQFDPVRNLMSRVAPHLLMARKGQGHLAVGQGMGEHFQDQRDAYDKSLLTKEKAGNLYAAMNDSLLKQRHFLSNYEAQKANHSETKRQHDLLAQHYKMGEEENRRHHEQLEGLRAHELAIKEKEREPKLKQYSKEEQQVIEKEENRIMQTLELQSMLSQLKTLYGSLSTGPIIGPLAEKGWDTLAHFGGMGPREKIALARAASNNLVMHLQQTMKGLPRTQRVTEIIQGGKPNSKNLPPTNLAIIKSYEELAALAMAYSRHRLKGVRRSPEEIESYIEKMRSHVGLPSSTTTPPDLDKMSKEEIEAYRAQKVQEMEG